MTPDRLWVRISACDFTTHGFLKDGASFTTIDYPIDILPFDNKRYTQYYASAYGINNAGQIVGMDVDVLLENMAFARMAPA